MVQAQLTDNVYNTVFYEYQPSQEETTATVKAPVSNSYLISFLTGLIVTTTRVVTGQPLEESSWEDELEDDFADDKESIDIMQVYLADISQYRVLTSQEQDTLFERFWQGDTSAKEKLVTGNLRLVITIAKRYMDHGLDLSDLVQEGNIGLINAVEAYDGKRGFRFSTCAAAYIKNAILHALTETGRTIRLPSYMQTLCSKVMKARRKLLQETGREPSIEALIKTTGLNEKKVRDALLYSLDPISLDTPTSRDDESCIGSYIESKYDTVDLSYVDRQNLLKLLLDAMKETLDDRETYIILNRYGLNGREPQPLGKIGENFHVSRERIRQLERQALGKIKSSSLAWILESYKDEL